MLCMTETITASQLLTRIERDFFSGARLAKASQLEGEERRAYRLAQVERLLTAKSGLPLATYLSDTFWVACEGRKLIKEPHPLLSSEGLQTLSDREKRRLQLIVEIAGLCHDLVLHYTFDLREAFGIRNRSFWVTNRRLVEWLTTTEHEQIAMHTAYIMKKEATKVYAQTYYQPAQDELAELFSSEYHEWVRQPSDTNMPPRDYVKTILDAMLRIERHWRRGRRLKLRRELIMLHDEIYGLIPQQFDRGVLLAAQELCDYMDTELKGRLVLQEYNYEALSWDEQPESVKRTTREVMTRFVDKVREVRAKYLAKGWLTDDSLAFGYLMAHAERCADGHWYEEDAAL